MAPEVTYNIIHNEGDKLTVPEPPVKQLVPPVHDFPFPGTHAEWSLKRALDRFGYPTLGTGKLGEGPPSAVASAIHDALGKLRSAFDSAPSLHLYEASPHPSATATPHPRQVPSAASRASGSSAASEPRPSSATADGRTVRLFGLDVPITSAAPERPAQPEHAAPSARPPRLRVDASGMPETRSRLQLHLGPDPDDELAQS